MSTTGLILSFFDSTLNHTRQLCSLNYSLVSQKSWRSRYKIFVRLRGRRPGREMGGVGASTSRYPNNSFVQGRVKSRRQERGRKGVHKISFATFRAYGFAPFLNLRIIHFLHNYFLASCYTSYFLGLHILTTLDSTMTFFIPHIP